VTKRYYSLDYGKGKIVLAWGSGEHDHSIHKTLIELLMHVPEGTILICERSLANFSRLDYNAGLLLALQRNIELRAVSTHAVKGYRKKPEINDPKPSQGATIADDIKDAKILLLLFGEGSKRAYGVFKPEQPKELPVELRARIKRLTVNARRNDGWKPQKKWLKSHGFELIPVLCSAFVAAQEIRTQGLGRRVYRKFTRISEFGRANAFHRSNGTHWLFRKSKKKDWSKLEDRKVRAKQVNMFIDKIWHQSGVVDGVLPI
jgi:hypothetical protein